jgi:hypothetical protein
VTEVSDHYSTLLVEVASDGYLIEQSGQLLIDSIIQGCHPMINVLEDAHFIEAEVFG